MDTETPASPLAAPKFDVNAQRRELRRQIPRRSELEHLVRESDGYAWLSPGILSALPAAISFSQQVYKERRLEAKPDPRGFRSSDLLAGTRYEDAPALFDLALSDEIIQLASDYFGELVVLAKPRLWLTTPAGPNAELGGTQMFHIGSRARPVVRRQAKFLFIMNDVDEDSGPFTFLPADVTAKILRAIDYEIGEEVTDEEIYRHARPADTRTLVGPPGTSLMVDTCRCFHFGRRASSKERLMLMIQFKRTVDVPETDRVERSGGFLERYGEDPVRKLIMPDW